MTSERWFIGDALRVGWKITREKMGFLILLFLGMFALTTGLSAILSRLMADDTPAAVRMAVMFFEWAIQIVVSMLMVRVSLALVDDEPIHLVDEVKALLPRILSYVAGSILYALICLGGFLLLVVPGVIWSIKFRYYAYFVIDEGMGPIEALRASARATAGYKWDLLGFGFVTGMVTLLGILALVVGLLVAAPTVLLAQAFVYRQLAGRHEKSGY